MDAINISIFKDLNLDFKVQVNKEGSYDIYFCNDYGQDLFLTVEKQTKNIINISFNGTDYEPNIDSFKAIYDVYNSLKEKYGKKEKNEKKNEIDYLTNVFPEILSPNVRNKWLDYVNRNTVNYISTQIVMNVAKYLTRIHNGEEKDLVLKEIGQSDMISKTAIATAVNIFSPEVLKKVNYPVDMGIKEEVTMEVPEAERFVPLVEDVTMEVPEAEKIERVPKYDKRTITQQFMEYSKNGDRDDSVDVFGAISRVVYGAPCEEYVTPGSVIVFYENKRVTRRVALADKLKKAGFDDLSEIVLKDPQKEKDLEMFRNLFKNYEEQLKVMEASLITDDDIKIYEDKKIQKI